MKKGIALLLLAACTVSMYGCGKETETVSVEVATDVVADDNTADDVMDEALDVEPDTSDDDDADEGEGALVSGDEDAASLEDYADQFLQYAALCMEYPDSYCSGSFDENMKIYAIAYTEALGCTTDATSDTYYSEYGMPMISQERFYSLSFRFFGERVNVESLPEIDEDNVYTNHVSRDEVNNVYVAVGDWGTMAPVGEGVNITYEGDKIIASQTIDMFDYEEGKVSSVLGTYTLELSVSAEDPSEFYIVDFTIDAQ